MDTITIENTWENSLAALLMLVTDGNHEGQKYARSELKRMAKLADLVGKEILIEVYAMHQDRLAADADQVEYYDIMARTKDGDILEEYEGILDWNEVSELIDRLQKKFPQAEYAEVGG